MESYKRESETEKRKKIAVWVLPELYGRKLRDLVQRKTSEQKVQKRNSNWQGQLLNKYSLVLRTFT